MILLQNLDPGKIASEIVFSAFGDFKLAKHGGSLQSPGLFAIPWRSFPRQLPAPSPCPPVPCPQFPGPRSLSPSPKFPVPSLLK